MRLVHSVAMLAIATGVVAMIADVNAASPLGDVQIAEAKVVQKGKGGQDFRPNPTGDGTTQQRGDKAGGQPKSIQQQIQQENQKVKSGAPK
jgi:hypothetical protein